MINSLLLLTAKPVIYLVNLSERDYARKKNKWLPKIKQWIDENLSLIHISEPTRQVR